MRMRFETPILDYEPKFQRAPLWRRLKRRFSKAIDRAVQRHLTLKEWVIFILLWLDLYLFIFAVPNGPLWLSVVLAIPLVAIAGPLVTFIVLHLPPLHALRKRFVEGRIDHQYQMLRSGLFRFRKGRSPHPGFRTIKR